MTTAYRVRCYVGDPLCEALRVGQQLDAEVLYRALIYRESRIRHAEGIIRNATGPIAQMLSGYIDEWSEEITALKRVRDRVGPTGGGSTAGGSPAGTR